MIGLLGFWTQYYFCIVAGVVAVLVLIGVIRKQGKQGAITYILKYLKMAVIGVLFYPLSINHIFFSYRGVGKAEITTGFGEKLVEYLNMIGYSFSVPVLAIAICLILFMFTMMAFSYGNSDFETYEMYFEIYGNNLSINAFFLLNGGFKWLCSMFQK